MMRCLGILLWGCFTTLLCAQTPRIYINELCASQDVKKDQYKQYSDWVELYNDEDTAVNIGGYFLSDDPSRHSKAQIDQRYAGLTTIPAKGYLVFWLSKTSPRQRPNFLKLSLSTNGEKLTLYNRDTVEVDQVKFPQQMHNMSYGRTANQEYRFFPEPTFGEPNATAPTKGRSIDVLFTKQGGIYEEAFTLRLQSFNSEALIYFTLDGTKPTIADSLLYRKPIPITATTTVRAIAVDEDFLPSLERIHTYFMQVQHRLPVVVITTDDLSMITNTNPQQNIYEEVPAYVEYIDTTGKSRMSVNGGIRLVGKAIRNYPQKSISFRMRGQYGDEAINYPLFPGKSHLRKHTHFLLRNSGNDWRETLFRDALMHSLVAKHTSVDYLAYDPVVVYINNQYFGIHNLREKISKPYIETNYPEVKKMDMVEYGPSLIQGDLKHLTMLENFFNTHDFTADAAYDSVQQWMDMDNFIDYQIAEIVYGNTDWPMANMKYWRPKTADGKWRWVLFDTDLAFRTKMQRFQGQHNTLAYALGENNYHLPVFDNSLQGSTLFLRKLMENETFKERFLLRMMDLLNTNFSTANMLHVIDSIQQKITPEMPRHIAQWGRSGGIPSMEKWQEEVADLQTFATQRPDTMRKFMQQQFALGAVRQINIKIQGTGNISLNSISGISNPFKGFYFEGQELIMRPHPDDEQRFSHWMVNGKKRKDHLLKVDCKSACDIVAFFQ